MVTMTVYSEVKRLYSSLQEMVGLRRRKRQLQISEPFNFQKETTVLPGLTEDEIAVLREKAVASRLGIAHANATSPDAVTPALLSPRLPPPRISSSPLSPSRSPPRLSIPTALPIPIPGNPSRHGSGSSSLRQSSTASAMTGLTAHPITASGGGSQVWGADKMSVSMSDLDLLLFGNPSGTSTVTTAVTRPRTVAGKEAPALALAMPMPMPASEVTKAGSASLSPGMISPLELDDGPGNGRVDWGMEFDFQLGSPVSPLSPASGGRKGLVGI